jgi:hypothetical protein
MVIFSTICILIIALTVFHRFLFDIRSRRLYVKFRVTLYEA